MKVLMIFLIIVLTVSLLALKKTWGLYKNSNGLYEKTTGEMRHIIETYDIWMRLVQDGYSVKEYLREKGIKTLALCRLTEIGIRLLWELKNSDIEIKYVIDAENVKLRDIKYVSLDEECTEEVDMVIITDMFDFSSVKEALMKKGYKSIDSIDGILYAMLKKQAEDQ